MELYVLILALWFTALIVVAIMIGMKILVETQALNRNLREPAERRPMPGVPPNGQHRRGE